MKYRLSDIIYEIISEDFDDVFDTEAFASQDEYEKAIDKKIEDTKKDLPYEMIVEIEDDTADIEEAISDAISETTGWLVIAYNYEKVEE